MQLDTMRMPRIESFNFDLDSGLLTIFYDEIIDIMTASTSAFTLVNTISGNDSVTLNDTVSQGSDVEVVFCSSC